MLQGEKALERADWWRDFVDKPAVGSRKAKLWWTQEGDECWADSVNRPAVDGCEA